MTFVRRTTKNTKPRSVAILQEPLVDSMLPHFNYNQHKIIHEQVTQSKKYLSKVKEHKTLNYLMNTRMTIIHQIEEHGVLKTTGLDRWLNMVTIESWNDEEAPILQA